ncbi:MAG: hypothetical protein ACUVUD_03955 [bacterium]
MKKVFSQLLIAISLTLAQSFFNIQGLGEPVYSATARTSALGKPVAISPGNPGNFIHLSKTSIEMTLGGIGTIGQQGNMLRGVFNIRPLTLYAAFPLPIRTRILLGVDEIFNQDFDIWSESLSEIAIPRHHIQSQGGIYSLNAGIAQSFLSHFCLGIILRSHLGGNREKWDYITTEGTIATDTIAIDYSALTARLGIAVQFNPVTFTASYDLPFNLTGRRWKLVHGATSDSLHIYQIQLPSILNVGAEIGSVWKTASLFLGLELRPWTQAKINDIAAGYVSTLRPSLGVEYELLPDLPLRLGYSATGWYCLITPTNKPIKEKTLHLGTGIPVPKFGTIDFAGEVIFRKGQTPSGWLKETSGRITLTLSYKETWSKRTRRWGY